MRFITSIGDLHSVIAALRGAGKRIGFVPTMGALHAGHMSLVRKSKAENDTTAVSVFVNPTQFGPEEDFEAYPRPIENDRRLCEQAGVDILFAPAAGEMYPGGYATYVLQERYTEAFEGEIRTGHFHGVCTVCCKLFNLLKPHRAYFGHKDYQQSVVIRRMVRDLNMDLEVEVCPTVRESDGLALSSRNVYLSPEERSQATALYAALRRAEEVFQSGERSVAPMADAMRKVIERAPMARVDYIAFVNPETLREVRRVESEAVILIAARLGRTRLIDNLRLTAK